MTIELIAEKIQKGFKLNWERRKRLNRGRGRDGERGLGETHRGEMNIQLIGELILGKIEKELKLNRDRRKRHKRWRGERGDVYCIVG